jgi:hypothetical protein
LKSEAQKIKGGQEFTCTALLFNTLKQTLVLRDDP